MRNSELNRSQQYRILVNAKLKNPPIDEKIIRFEYIKEKLKETLDNWDSLSNDEKICYFKSGATKLFKEWFKRYLGRVDNPPDLRDDRPTARKLTIKDPDSVREILLEYDIGESDEKNFVYIITPVINIEDFENICEHILLPSQIFQQSGVLSIIREHLPPDTRSWIRDGQQQFGEILKFEKESTHQQ